VVEKQTFISQKASDGKSIENAWLKWLFSNMHANNKQKSPFLQ